MSECVTGDNAEESGLSNRVPPAGTAGNSRVGGKKTRGAKPFLVPFFPDTLTSEHKLEQPVEQPAVATAVLLPGTLSATGFCSV